MDNYQEETYGERIAGIYDTWYPDYEVSVIAALHHLAQGGRALELGIGTGRIALPLQHAGLDVHGIEASEAMLARLRAKPGGATIPMTLGNFADVAVDGHYALIYVLFNTFFALLTQEEQVRCVRNVAQHLTPQGVFVVEAFVPDLTRFSGQQALRTVRISTHDVRLEASQHDPVLQQITSQYLVVTEEGTRLYPVQLRYVWPAELDLMAQLAGLRHQDRWGDWQGACFPGTVANIFRSMSALYRLVGREKRTEVQGGRRCQTRPNQGVQATANSVRSCLAPALCCA
ncbi:MAG: class I SAM-dependent methyltransferase [Candidatus Tectomicrobia bacterium]|uniref:Class I SAM-dependent methyltransferase n=1 Tax=Tectimicrobiota bacterium TaxID=2528274 RepID=A0A937VZR1_UNCTE|nr:class I SAM-dependent methyltransferase [Candidatus Tectomicrobia bacterium]